MSELATQDSRAGFTPQQRAELRDSFARSRLAAVAESQRLAKASFELRRAAESTKKQFPKKAKQRRRMAAVVVEPEPARQLDAPPPPNTQMEVVLTRADLTTPERFVFDRVYAACNTEFSTVDVVTHAALVARAVVAARRANA